MPSSAGLAALPSWPIATSATTTNQPTVPWYVHRVSAARTSVLDYEVLESHTRMDGGVPASQCCSWDYKGNVLNRGGGPPLVGSTTTFPPPSRRPPPPPSTTARICTSRGLVECGDRCMPQDGVCCNAEGYYCEAVGELGPGVFTVLHKHPFTTLRLQRFRIPYWLRRCEPNRLKIPVRCHLLLSQ